MEKGKPMVAPALTSGNGGRAEQTPSSSTGRRKKKRGTVTFVLRGKGRPRCKLPIRGPQVVRAFVRLIGRRKEKEEHLARRKQEKRVATPFLHFRDRGTQAKKTYAL